jgi:hypothetical protein
MIRTIAQAKALIRATPEDRLGILTEVTLETESDEVVRFCEAHRWLLGQDHRREAHERVARVQRIIEDAHLHTQEGCDGMDGEED